MAKVWLITGTSKGFGRIWAEAALQRGDEVVATARNVDTLAALTEAHGDAVLTPLDVTDKPAVDAAIAAGHERFGRLDVVVNNAGYGLFGAVEEVSEEQARADRDEPVRRAVGDESRPADPTRAGIRSHHPGLLDRRRAGLPDRRSLQRGDPRATGPAILEIVDAEDPPLRVFFGDGPLQIIREEYARRLALWEEWAELSVRAHGGSD
jgi:short chain dehydrogenase